MTCISPIYVRKAGQFVPCGKCGFCIKKAIEAWVLRISHEMEDSSSAYFFTLTYNDENLPPNRQLDKTHLQDFFRSLRKKHKGIRYFAIGEYGTQMGRPHYHAVIFNLPDAWDDIVTRSWNKGFVSGSRAVMGRIRYMVEYMALPTDNPSWEVKPFRIMSRKPGIGYNYVQKKNDSIVGERTP